MPDDAEIIPNSLCDDCPISEGCKFGKYGIIITTCGKRAKYESEGPKDRHEAQKEE